MRGLREPSKAALWHQWLLWKYPNRGCPSPPSVNVQVSYCLVSVITQSSINVVLSRRNSYRNHHLLHSGQNQFGVIKLRVPSPSGRNQTVCEDHEDNHFSMMLFYGKFQCKEACTLHGAIGGFRFEGASRVRKSNKPDGSNCELRAAGEGKVDLS